MSMCGGAMVSLKSERGVWALSFDMKLGCGWGRHD